MDAFFVMPAQALTALERELSNLVPEEAVAGVLFRYGFRCGDTMAKGMELRTREPISPDLLKELWLQIGLGRMKSARWKHEGIMEVGIEDPLPDAEAMYPEGAYPFHRGYLAGMLTGLTDGRYHCEMIRRKKAHVTFRLQRRDA
jgi:hypothetical protein